MGKVRNILQKKGNVIFSIDPDSSVYDALELMLEKDLGALLVIENGKFIGIFTERDYARKIILKGKASKETLVREVMSEHPVTVTPDNSVEECMQLMVGHRFRHLPVLNGNELVGLVSIGDLVKFIIEEQRTIIEDLEHYITGH